MNLPELTNEPRWYHLGDPDYVLVAFFYGAPSLVIISIVEYISASLLFSEANAIIISDGTAHIASNNSSWLEVFRWIFMKRPSKTTGSARRICKRAVIALFILIDFSILASSLPRTINVNDQDVGSTEMSFSDILPSFPLSFYFYHFLRCVYRKSYKRKSRFRFQAVGLHIPLSRIV